MAFRGGDLSKLYESDVHEYKAIVESVRLEGNVVVQ